MSSNRALILPFSTSLLNNFDKPVLKKCLKDDIVV